MYSTPEFSPHPTGFYLARHPIFKFAIASLAILCSLPSAAQQQEKSRWLPHLQGDCTTTANLILDACLSEGRHDFYLASARCLNLPDREGRTLCDEQAQEELDTGQETCFGQYGARNALCERVGEDRYDPAFVPGRFVDPGEIGITVPANPYFPMVPGTEWVYEEGEAMIHVVVTEKTKLIEGVICRVVNDVVSEDGDPVEDTDDWVAQDVDGNTWYCGERVTDYETFEGDSPMEPELVSIDGSFKTGRDGAKPGYWVPANPQVGQTYRQEVDYGNAEDAAEVLSLTGSAATPAAACSGNCLVTREFTPIEPGQDVIRYYAPGVGLILTTDLEGNVVEKLVEFKSP